MLHSVFLKGEKMKLGEIKLEALTMIYPGEVFNVIEDNLEETLNVIKSDPNFSDYFASMPGIINRCFGILENKGVLPTEQREVIVDRQTPSMQRFNLRELVSNYRMLDRVAFEGKNGESYASTCEFTRESDGVIVLPWMGEGKYIFIYTPKIPRVNLLSPETTDILPFTDDIASLIPYFIKSELLYTEHPDDAKLSRSLFEQALANLLSHKENYQGTVETIYGVD